MGRKANALPKDVATLLGKARKQGFEYREDKHGVTVYAREGDATAWLSRNAGGRGIANMKADLRRIGVKID